MPEDIATLGLAVDSRAVTKAARELKRMEKQSGKTEKATDGFAVSVKKLAVQLGAFVSVTAGISKLINTARSFDVINASLITVTGSSERATQAFDGIQKFAATTPYALEEVSNAFIKLAAYGLTPSKRALISYGNTAAAMGKNLDQMIEAVADAATMEFERLKEFGIKARKEGDNIKFTFRGVTTSIKANSEDIQEYLLKIGETDFAGAMARRAETLDGALSNLGDTWDMLFLTVSQSGVGDAMKDGVLATTDALEQLDAYIASGALQKSIDSIAIQFYAVGEDVEMALSEIRRMLGMSASDWEEFASDSVNFIIDAFRYMPANIRAYIKIMTIEIAAFIDKVKANVGALAELLNPSNWFSGNFSIEGVYGNLKTQLKDIDSVRFDSISTILKERDALIKKADAEQKAATIAFNAEKKQRAKSGGELPRINLKGDSSLGGVDSATKVMQDELDKLELSMMSAELKLEKVYENRIWMVEDAFQNEVISYEKKAQLLQQIDEKYSEEKLKLATQTASDWNRVWSRAGDRFAAGIGDAVASVVFEQENMANTMKSVAKGVGMQVVSTLVEIAVKKTALALLGKAEIAATTASLVASAGTIATAMAPAAAATSLATAGANTVPATAGISSTYALAGSLSLMGIAHSGLDYVPKEGTYLLQKGEMVLKKEDAKQMRSGGSVIVNMPINISALDAAGVDSVLRNHRGTISNIALNAVRRVMESSGRRSVV